MKVGDKRYLIRVDGRYFGKRNNQPFASYDAAEYTRNRRHTGGEIVLVELRTVGVMKPVPDAS